MAVNMVVLSPVCCKPLPWFRLRSFRVFTLLHNSDTANFWSSSAIVFMNPGSGSRAANLAVRSEQPAHALGETSI